MFGAHPVAAAAQISAAFETLRNPLKRRAYDEAMGLSRPPEPKPRQWSMAIPGQTTRGFVASVPGRAEKVTGGTLAEERLQRLARLAEPGPLAEPAPELRRTAATKAERPAPTPVARSAEAPPRPPAEAMFASEELRPHEWKRPLLTLVGLFLAAGLIGALAGSSVMGPEQAQPSAPLARHAVGRTKPALGRTKPALSPPLEAPVEPPVGAAFAPAKRERADRRPRVSGPRLDATAPVEPAMTDSSASSPAPQVADAGNGAPPSAMETVAASGLPIAAGVMARTIERIGYACGSVASATPAQGAGVYKLTCTSGDIYRATPVHGRYRFKRWSNR